MVVKGSPIQLVKPPEQEHGISVFQTFLPGCANHGAEKTGKGTVSKETAGFGDEWSEAWQYGAGDNVRPPEELRSFDMLSSVDMMRFDVLATGHVLPETRQRVYDEELSYIAEGIDRASRTSFVLQRGQDGELVYFDRGQWRPYQAMLLTGMQVAGREAAADPRHQFLADRSAQDLINGYRMQCLQPGEQLVWHSPYPYEQQELHGQEFMKTCGFVPSRQMAFIYRAMCNQAGEIVLESQTVDRSDDEAFAAVHQALEYDPQAELDTLVRTYDGTLHKKHGGYFYAGRRDVEARGDMWQQLQAQADLIAYFLDGLEVLARHGGDRQVLDYEARKLRLGTYQALKNRLDGKTGFGESADSDAIVRGAGSVALGGRSGVGQIVDVEREFRQAMHEVEAFGITMVGCGGETKLASAGSVLNGSVGTIMDAIFGAAAGSQPETPERYSFNLKMYCAVCQAPPKKEAKKQWCGPCGLCRGCDARAKAKQTA